MSLYINNCGNRKHFYSSYMWREIPKSKCKFCETMGKHYNLDVYVVEWIKLTVSSRFYTTVSIPLCYWCHDGIEKYGDKIFENLSYYVEVIESNSINGRLNYGFVDGVGRFFYECEYYEKELLCEDLDKLAVNMKIITENKCRILAVLEIVCLSSDDNSLFSLLPKEMTDYIVKLIKQDTIV